MSGQQKKWMFAMVYFLVAACGVKGKPLPPLEPAELGRGAPTYKRTAIEAKPATIPAFVPTPAPTPARGER